MPNVEGNPEGAKGGTRPELVVITLFGEGRAPFDAPFHASLHLGGGGGELGAAREVEWQPWSAPVEGIDHVFWLRMDDERWAAFARIGPLRIVLAATRWERDEVRLAVVDPSACLG